jgi:hypothetical protein
MLTDVSPALAEVDGHTAARTMTSADTGTAP